ncbi:MAG: pilus assembly PilX family protein [Pontibacterium sp.]
MMNKQPVKLSAVKQKGSVLIITLILLVIMVFIGTAGIEVTSLEEKMAGSMRDRQIAFEGAEAALIAGEEYLESLVILPAFDGTNGLYTPTSGDGLWKNWSALTTRTLSPTDGGFSQLSAMPEYIIEELAAVSQDDSLEAGKAIEERKFYRITARAVGMTGSSEVILQSMYKR